MQVSSRLSSLSEALGTEAATADAAAASDVAAKIAAAARKSEEEAEKAAAEARAADGLDEEITQVVVGLEAAKKIVEGQSAQTELLTQAKSAVLNGNAFFSTKPEGAPVGCR